MTKFIFFLLAGYVGLFFVPVLGEILEFFAGFLIVGALWVLLMVSLVIEAASGRISRIWLLVPLCAYGAYYAVWAYQANIIEHKSAELSARNPGQVLVFDSAKYSLVTRDAEVLVTRYKVAATFAPGRTGYRLLSKDQCIAAKELPWGRALQFGLYSDNPMHSVACGIRTAEEPPNRRLEVVTRGDPDWVHTVWGFNERVYELSGVTFAKYYTASVWRWSALPFVGFSCSFSGMPKSLKCQTYVSGEFVQLKGIPGGIDGARYDRPESVMLGLPKYVSSDALDFRGSDPAFDIATVLSGPK